MDTFPSALMESSKQRFVFEANWDESTWRPLEGTPAENMDVKVRHGFATVGSIVDCDSKSLGEV